jgi:hypothetical protein
MHRLDLEDIHENALHEKRQTNQAANYDGPHFMLTANETHLPPRWPQ